MFDILSGVLGLAGPLLGAAGGNDVSTVPTQISGFKSNPQEVQDYLLDSIFPRITDWGKTPYPTVPLRRANAEDYDPIFGSPARQWMQQYYDNQRLVDMAANRPDTTNDTTAEAKEIADLEARMIARQYMQGDGASPMETTRQAKRRQMYEAGLYDDAALTDIGTAMLEAQRLGVPYDSAAGRDLLNRKNPDLMANATRGFNSALLEAAKRKGLI